MMSNRRWDAGLVDCRKKERRIKSAKSQEERIGISQLKATQLDQNDEAKRRFIMSCGKVQNI